MIVRVSRLHKSSPARVVQCVAALLIPPAALAICKEPLPDADLHGLDQLAVGDPVAADRQVRAALESISEPRRRAQLFAILADAHSTTGEDAAALKDVADGRSELDVAGSFSGADSVGLRLALVEADAAQGRESMLGAADGLDRWREAAQKQPIGRACLLLVRSRVLSRLGMHEQSAREGLEAHAISERSGSAGAMSETHLQLANAFRRAGLFDQSLPHVDASIALSRKQDQAAALSSATYLKAQILGDMGRTLEAREIMLESRRISNDLGDVVSNGFADQALCQFEWQLGQMGAARDRCRIAREVFAKAGREDMVALVDETLARIDITEGNPAAALTRLREVMRDGASMLPPMWHARAYRDLADAHAQLNQPAKAVVALRRSLEVEEAAQQRQRSLAAALTLAQFERIAQERREAQLSREVDVRRTQAEAASASRQRAWALLAGSVVIIGLLLAWLGASRRNSRVLRRQEALLKAASEHSPDALVLLTADGRVRLASRDLFGQGAAPLQHGLLIDSVPASQKPVMREVLSLLLEDGVSVERDLRVEAADAAGGWRDIELRARPILQGTRVIGATVRASDVTARRALERTALEWQGQQREKTGGGLHEGLAQELAGVAMQLGAIVSAQRSGKVVAPDTIEASIAQLSGAIAVTRGLVGELSPLSAGRGSLPDALRALAEDTGRRRGSPVLYSGPPETLRELGRASGLLYRISELALALPLDPPGSGATTLGLEIPHEGVVLVVEGSSGFAAVDPGRLQLIRYLATLLGASTVLQQIGDNGWRLRVEVPQSGLSR